jgi:hypothetical protein
MHIQYSLSDYKRKIFETCRRQEELNKNITLKVHFVGLHYIIVSMHGTQEYKVRNKLY